MNLAVDPSPSSPSSSASASSSCSTHLLHIRSEPFEYGLLPFPSFILSDPVSSLKELRHKFLQILGQWNGRITTKDIAEALELPHDHAQLVLHTLASVLPDYDPQADPLSRALATEIDAVGADIDDLILFLYIQNYKRPPPRPHKDAAAVADVWPSTSAFDGFLSTLSPLQVRSNRRTMPSQAQEEAHRLSYIQKHLLPILTLLAEPQGNDESDSQILTVEKFNRLGFLFQAGQQGTGLSPLSQAAPFFANSDPMMPAAPVPLMQVLEWVAECIFSRSCHPERNLIQKENGRIDGSDSGDVTMVDAYVTSMQSGQLPNGLNKCFKEWHHKGMHFIDGVTKASVVKNESDVGGGSVKVSSCHDAAIYVLAPLKYASVYGCSDSVVVLGAIGKVLKVEHCERVQLIAATVRIRIANCRECLFYLGVNQQPVVLGDNYKLQVAPYNTFYSKLETHMTYVHVDPRVNKWDDILTLGVVDPHDSHSYLAGAADSQAGASILPPERYMNFVIPQWNDEDDKRRSLTKTNPFSLPKAYMLVQQRRNKSVDILLQTLKSVPIDEMRKRDLSNAIHIYFKDWLYASGNIRQLYDVQVGDLGPEMMD